MQHEADDRLDARTLGPLSPLHPARRDRSRPLFRSADVCPPPPPGSSRQDDRSGAYRSKRHLHRVRKHLLIRCRRSAHLSIAVSRAFATAPSARRLHSPTTLTVRSSSVRLDMLAGHPSRSEYGRHRSFHHFLLVRQQAVGSSERALLIPAACCLLPAAYRLSASPPRTFRSRPDRN